MFHKIIKRKQIDGQCETGESHLIKLCDFKASHMPHYLFMAGYIFILNCHHWKLKLHMDRAYLMFNVFQT